jgi:lipoprotein-releasing system permease protein
MRLSLRIAWRFLKSSPVQTSLILLGIAVGISVQVFIGSLIGGLQNDLIDTAVGSSSQITATPATRGELISDWEPLLAGLSGISGITEVSPTADAPGFLGFEDREDTFPVTVRGFDFTAAEGIYGFGESLISGTLPGASNQILVGQKLAEEAGIAPGDTVLVLTPTGQPKEVQVSGVFDLGNASLNERWLAAGIPLVQDIFGLGTGITSIEMQVSDVFAADTLAAEAAKILPDSLDVTNWKVENEALLSGLRGQSISSYMIQLFVVVSVLLGIASVLAVSVIQKSKQIGILKAMGIKDKDASLVFLFQGLMLGILGSGLGILLGIGLGWSFTKFALNPDGTPVVALLIDPGFIALSGLLGVVASVIAALLPGIRSSRLNPIEVIRNG